MTLEDRLLHLEKVHEYRTRETTRLMGLVCKRYDALTIDLRKRIDELEKLIVEFHPGTEIVYESIVYKSNS